VYEFGIYRVGEDAVKAKLAEIIRHFKGAFRHFKFPITGIDNEIMYLIKYKSLHLDFPFNNHVNLLPIGNGILFFDFEAGKVELLQPDPKYLFTYRINASYDPKADSSRVDQMISEYTEYPEILYQIPAQAILQMMGYGPYKKAYLLQGRPDAGKTTYLEFLWSCFGLQNRADVSLNELNTAENRFKLASLVGKIFNLHDDLRSFPLKDVGTFKRVTGAYS
jgi:phage/plasmid-associated DNA primase